MGTPIRAMGQTEARLRLEGKVDDTRRLLVIVMSVLALVLAMPVAATAADTPKLPNS